MDFSEIQFCDDVGYCICGNDCGAGCCTTSEPCEGHRLARVLERVEMEAAYDAAAVKRGGSDHD